MTVNTFPLLAASPVTLPVILPVASAGFSTAVNVTSSIKHSEFVPAARNPTVTSLPFTITGSTFTVVHNGFAPVKEAAYVFPPDTAYICKLSKLPLFFTFAVILYTPSSKFT